MPYRLKAHESVPEGIKRIAGEQIERAIKELTDSELDPHESVHQARKRFKKIRGVLRLVREDLGEIYSDENAWFRDTGRELSAVRDAEAMLETLDKLRDGYDEQLKKTDSNGFCGCITD
jgi:CHAD domain-containing protein